MKSVYLQQIKCMSQIIVLFRNLRKKKEEEFRFLSTNFTITATS